VAGLIEMGANVNAASKTGFTPIVFAAVKDDVSAIRRLLAAGANPNVALVSGAKPLIVAMQYRHTAAALALLDLADTASPPPSTTPLTRTWHSCSSPRTSSPSGSRWWPGWPTPSRSSTASAAHSNW
jgi:ankyrin repeat protein